MIEKVYQIRTQDVQEVLTQVCTVSPLHTLLDIHGENALFTFLHWVTYQHLIRFIVGYLPQSKASAEASREVLHGLLTAIVADKGQHAFAEAANSWLTKGTNMLLTLGMDESAIKAQLRADIEAWLANNPVEGD